MAVSPDDILDDVLVIVNALGSVTDINDNEGHAAVMRLFAEAIRQMEEAGR